MIVVHLPWPSSTLSPNARVHPREKAEVVSNHRMIARAAVREQELPPVTWQRIAMEVEFYPPDKRHRDLDNMFAMCKSYFDGIFDAMGINDALVKRATLVLSDHRKDNGGVMIILNEF